jgi:hypothetical protein
MPHDKFDDSETRYVVQEEESEDNWADFFKESHNFAEGMVALVFARQQHKEGSFRLKRIDVWY